MQADSAQLNVLRQSSLTDQLGQCAARDPAADIHLEESVLRVDVPLEEKQVMFVLRLDMRHTQMIASDSGRRIQLSQFHRRSGIGAGSYRRQNREHRAAERQRY